MKHLMRYEGYTAQQRADDLLDKISKHGIKSISTLEKDFLDAHKIGKEDEIHNILTKKESECTFDDDFGMFRFEFDKIEKVEDDIKYHGNIYYTKPVSEEIYLLTGHILYDNNSGFVMPEFYLNQNGKKLDILTLCGEYGYELDNFLDYVISEIGQK